MGFTILKYTKESVNFLISKSYLELQIKNIINVNVIINIKGEIFREYVTDNSFGIIRKTDRDGKDNIS